MNLAALIVLCLVEEPAWKCEFLQDFRDGRLNRGMLQVVGTVNERYLEQQADGLRVRLAGDQAGYGYLGVGFRTRLRGDFEITVAYALLRADRSQRGDGSGTRIHIGAARTGDSPRHEAVLEHVCTSGGGYQYRVQHRILSANAALENTDRVFPARAGSGQLRLLRRDKTLSFLAASGPKEPFQELYNVEFSPAGILWVNWVAQGGGSGRGVEVLWTDLSVRADEFTGLVDLEPPTKSHAWWAWLISVLLVAVVAGGVAALWRYKRWTAPATSQGHRQSAVAATRPAQSGSRAKRAGTVGSRKTSRTETRNPKHGRVES